MKYRAAAVLSAAIMLIASTASAHHSFAAGYDGEKTVELTGTVAGVEWANPHIHFTVDVTAEDGTVSQWRFEGYPPNMLVRQGWRRDVTMKPGDMVTVFGWQARTEPNLGAARWVTLSDGRKMAAGPPAGTGGR